MATISRRSDLEKMTPRRMAEERIAETSRKALSETTKGVDAIAIWIASAGHSGIRGLGVKPI
jgi:hypothetical protein